MLKKYNHVKLQGKSLRFSGLTIIIASVCLLCSLAPVAIAQDAERGEMLYWNHCGSCHDESVHSLERRRAESKEEVYVWVLAWSVHNGLFWDDEDVEDVTLFLSRYLYEFEI